MIPKQMALSQLARLALNAACDSSPADKADVCQIVGAALAEDCPDLSQLAIRAASQFSQATQTEADLLAQLDTRP